MLKKFFNIPTSAIIFIFLACLHTSVHASSLAHILTEKPSSPPEDITVYNLSYTENFKRSKNHFYKSKGRTTENAKVLSFNAEVGDHWEWGIDYVYYNSKTQFSNDNRADYAKRHEFLPNVYYFFNPEIYVMLAGGARFSHIRIFEDVSGTLSKAKTSSVTPIAAIQVGIDKDYSTWAPSINAAVLYENEKTNKYVLGNVQTNKRWEHSTYGQITARLDMKMHQVVQPYGKVAYQYMLRRSRSYTIHTWDGWLYTAGVNININTQWSPYVEFNHNRNLTGDRDNVIQIGIGYSF